MAGKFLRREFALLQERLEFIHNNFEVCLGLVSSPPLSDAQVMFRI